MEFILASGDCSIARVHNYKYYGIIHYIFNMKQKQNLRKRKIKEKINKNFN